MGSLIALLGPTGAGKSVQGELLAEELGGVHLSSGDLLRKDEATAEKLKNGRLAPALLVEELVGKALSTIPADQAVFLDGFPRTISNAKWIDREMPAHGRNLERIFVILLDYEMVRERLLLRHRADDAKETIKVKWGIFQEQMDQLERYYKGRDILRKIDGSGKIGVVNGLIRAQLP